MGITQALTWVVQNGDHLSTISLLLLIVSFLIYGFGTDRIVTGKLYRQICDERDAEREGHDTARAALEETRIDLAEATTGALGQQQRIMELERALARCEGQTQVWRTDRPPSSPRPRPRRSR